MGFSGKKTKETPGRRCNGMGRQGSGIFKRGEVKMWRQLCELWNLIKEDNRVPLSSLVPKTHNFLRDSGLGDWTAKRAKALYDLRF